MELLQDEIDRIKKLLSAKPVSRDDIKPISEVSPGCEFCTGNCIGSCKSTCSDLQESKPCREQEDDTSSNDYDDEGECYSCGGCCSYSCYGGCGEMCDAQCRNSCDSRCGATCEFCCDGQCGVTVSSDPKDYIRKLSRALEDDDEIPL